MPCPKLVALLALAGAACAGAGEARPSLEQILQCNAKAAGAGALAELDTVEYRLEITEPGFTVQGHYRATRDGRVRIDIHAEGGRVFAEGLHDGRAWMWQRGDERAKQGSDKGAAALRHGIEQPGHFYALIHMADEGHQVELAGRETADGRTYDVVAVTLADGFQQWYWVARESCLVERKRSFRAFHPDMDPTETWVETRNSDFRVIDGVTRAFLSENVELATGEVLGATRVLAYVPNPSLKAGEFDPP